MEEYEAFPSPPSPSEKRRGLGGFFQRLFAPAATSDADTVSQTTPSRSSIAASRASSSSSSPAPFTNSDGASKAIEDDQQPSKLRTESTAAASGSNAAGRSGKPQASTTDHSPIPENGAPRPAANSSQHVDAPLNPGGQTPAELRDQNAPVRRASASSLGPRRSSGAGTRPAPVTTNRTLPTVLQQLRNIERNSTVSSADESRDHWMPDDTTTQCYDCGRPFTTFRRRHHCRICGQIFCWRCCGTYVPDLHASSRSTGTPLRCCSYCAQVIKAQPKQLGRLQRQQSGLFSSSLLATTGEAPAEVNPMRGSSAPASPATAPSFTLFANGTVPDAATCRILLRVALNDASLHVGDHRERMVTYPNSFVSSEFVGWLVLRGWIKTRQEGVVIGQTLLDNKDIVHVRHSDQLFVDEYQLFQVTDPSLLARDDIADDETRRIEQSAPSWFREIIPSTTSLEIGSQDVDTFATMQREPSLPQDAMRSELEEAVARMQAANEDEDRSQRDTPERTLALQASNNTLPMPFESRDRRPSSHNLPIVSSQGTTDPGTASARPSSISPALSQPLNVAGSRGQASGGTTQLHQAGPDGRKAGSSTASGMAGGVHLTSPPPDLLSETGDEDGDAARAFIREANEIFLHNLAKQLVVHSSLHSHFKDTVMSLVHTTCKRVHPDVRNGDTMDIRDYVKVRCLPGDKPESSQFFSGVVFSKNVAHKKMKTRLVNPRILMLKFPVELGWRGSSRYASLDFVHMQEEEFLKKIVRRISALRPNIVVAQRSVARTAQDLLLKAGITLMMNVDERNMNYLARCSGAVVVESVEQLNLSVSIGKCQLFELRRYIDGDGREHKLAVFDGCAPHLGATILLRGGPFEVLRDIRRALLFLCYIEYSLLLEEAFLATEFAYIPENAVRHWSRPETKWPPQIKPANLPADIPPDDKRAWTERSSAFQRLLNSMILSSSPQVMYPVPFLYRASARQLAAVKLLPSTLHWSSHLFGPDVPPPPNAVECFRPQSHDSIEVLYSSWAGGKQQSCVEPYPIRMQFYGKNDVTLGYYIEEFCLNAEYQCPSEHCDEHVFSHVRSFAHGHGRILVGGSNLGAFLPDLSPGGRPPIYMWSWCPQCDPQGDRPSAVLPMDKQTWHFSLAKFLELTLYTPEYMLCGQLDKHSLHHSVVRYFGCKNVTVYFEYQPITLLEVELPPRRIQMPRKESALSFWRNTFNQLRDVNKRAARRVPQAIRALEPLCELVPDLASQLEDALQTCLINMEDNNADLEEADQAVALVMKRCMTDSKTLENAAQARLDRATSGSAVSSEPQLATSTSSSHPSSVHVHGTDRTSSSDVSDNGTVPVRSETERIAGSTAVSVTVGVANSKDAQSPFSEDEGSRQGNTLHDDLTVPTSACVGGNGTDDMGDDDDDADAAMIRHLDEEAATAQDHSQTPLLAPVNQYGADDILVPYEETRQLETLSYEVKQRIMDSIRTFNRLLESVPRQAIAKYKRKIAPLSKSSSMPVSPAAQGHDTGDHPSTPTHPKTPGTHGVLTSDGNELATSPKTQLETVHERQPTSDVVTADVGGDDLSVDSDHHDHDRDENEDNEPVVVEREWGASIKLLSQTSSHASDDFYSKRATTPLGNASGTLPRPLKGPFDEMEHHPPRGVSDVGVTIYEEETSSLIAYTLSSHAYDRYLRGLVPEDGGHEKSASKRHSRQPSTGLGLATEGTSSHGSPRMGSPSVGPNSRRAYSPHSRNPSTAGAAEGGGDGGTSSGVDTSSEDQQNAPAVASQQDQTPSTAPEADAITSEAGADTLQAPSASTHHGKGGEATSQHFVHTHAVDGTKFFCHVLFAKEFRKLRHRLFFGDAGPKTQQEVREDAFIHSLSRCVKWAAHGGKSGAEFSKVTDDRFIIKELSRREAESLARFMPAYFAHLHNCLDNNIPTALAKIVGLYRIGFTNSRRNMRREVLVMENLFFNHDSITKVFDLKGSERSRLVDETRDVLLDENLLHYINHHPLYIRPHSKAIITRAIENDTRFLADQNVMDYSLLVGIDSESDELCVGIIDYLRTFTLDKKIESMLKSSGILGGGAHMPTVISPELYRRRFRDAMGRYFFTVPDAWTATSAVRLSPETRGIDQTSGARSFASGHGGSTPPEAPPATTSSKDKAHHQAQSEAASQVHFGPQHSTDSVADASFMGPPPQE